MYENEYDHMVFPVVNAQVMFEVHTHSWIDSLRALGYIHQLLDYFLNGKNVYAKLVKSVVRNYCFYSK